MKEYEKIHTNSGMVNISGLAEAIKNARIGCKLSRIKAGAYCGVSEITFLRWEQGATKSIKEDSYNKLVDILNGECCA